VTLVDAGFNGVLELTLDTHSLGEGSTGDEGLPVIYNRICEYPNSQRLSLSTYRAQGNVYLIYMSDSVIIFNNLMKAMVTMLRTPKT
jgi:hypothetical protein